MSGFDRYRRGEVFGIMAEFVTVDDLRSAAVRLSNDGYKRVSIYAPYSIPALAGMFRTTRSRVRHVVIAPIVFFGGVGGAITAIGMQEYANLVSYPLNIGGRPLNSWPAFVPVTFELTILGAAFAAVFALLLVNRLPQFYHPVFNVDRFARATQDRFFLCAEASDPKFDRTRTRELLRAVPSVSVEEVVW